MTLFHRAMWVAAFSVIAIADIAAAGVALSRGPKTALDWFGVGCIMVGVATCVLGVYLNYRKAGEFFEARRNQRSEL